MKISTRTRYGARLMLSLGLSYDKGPIFLKDIAEKENISEKYLSQIVIPLKTAGLVNSFRGAHGGYTLGRSPAQITMKDVVEILEGDFDLAGCADNPSPCPRALKCVTRDLWSDLGNTIADKLSSTTVEDLVARFESKQKHTVAYMI